MLLRLSAKRTQMEDAHWLPERRTLMLSVGDSGAGFVVLPRLCRFSLGGWSDVRILHDYARTGVPSQNGIVVSGYCKIHGLLIVIHCFPQRVICGCAGSS